MNAEKFNQEWRANSYIAPATADQVRHMIQAHYLGKWPGVSTCTLALWVGPFLRGVIVFAEPPPETSVRYGEKTWELARLWIDDGVPRNAETWLISQAVKYIKRTYPDIKHLVSYADPSAGHSGRIYKAANWQEDGRTDDDRKSPRCDYVDATGKKYSRRQHIPDGVQVTRVPRVSKYRFHYPLTSAQRVCNGAIGGKVADEN